jgi:hypothetical protein
VEETMIKLVYKPVNPVGIIRERIDGVTGD